MKLLNVSGSPHVHSDESTKKIMWRVNLALVPSLIVAIAFFGLNALLISIVSVGSCILFQWLIEKFLLKTESTISDGSAVVTGLLLAFNVPATREMILLVIIAALVAIGIGKMSFGGLGKNPFNPALVGRVFMLISFPVQMTTWPKPGQNLFSMVSVGTGHSHRRHLPALPPRHQLAHTGVVHRHGIHIQRHTVAVRQDGLYGSADDHPHGRYYAGSLLYGY